MWEHHGRNGHMLPIGRPGEPGKADARPPTPDATSAPPTDSAAETATPFPSSPLAGERAGERGPAETATPSLLFPHGGEAGRGVGAWQDAAWWQRVRTRQLIREFLRSTPRSEEQTALAIPSADGGIHLITRGQMSAAIDHMRPRMRQVVRLTLEEGWPRQRVCSYLHNFSMKTLERDQVEGLDLLADL